MQIRHFLFLFIFFTFGLAVHSAENRAGFADPILGVWDVTISDPSGNVYPSWFEITLETENKIKALFVGRIGSVRPVRSIEYNNGQLILKIDPQYEKRTTDLIFTGKVSGQKIEGTTNSEDGKTFNWQAIRAPSLKTPKKLSWGKSIELFNAKDLSGWSLRSWGEGNCWTVEQGLLTNRSPCVDLKTKHLFSDFKLNAEFKIPENGNSGIYLRGRYELQISDAFGQALDSLRQGGIYGFIRPSVNASRAIKKFGEWQTYEVTLMGKRVSVVLNSIKIIDDIEIPGITGGALDSNEGQPGPILLQGDHSKVWFKRVTITPSI